MAAHDAEQFEVERDALEQFLLKWHLPSEGLRGWGWGYDPSVEMPNAPRWWTWRNEQRDQLVRSWNCAKCRTPLVRQWRVQPIVAVLGPSESCDGQRHTHDIHPGGLCMIVQPVPMDRGMTPDELRQYREVNGRRRGKWAPGLQMWGWWMKDQPIDTVQTWCPRCQAYKVTGIHH